MYHSYKRTYAIGEAATLGAAVWLFLIHKDANFQVYMAAILLGIGLSTMQVRTSSMVTDLTGSPVVWLQHLWILYLLLVDYTKYLIIPFPHYLIKEQNFHLNIVTVGATCFGFRFFKKQWKKSLVFILTYMALVTYMYRPMFVMARHCKYGQFTKAI